MSPAAMNVVEYPRPGPFLERVKPTLAAAESENNLILGVAAMVRAAGGRAFCATVDDGAAVALAAIWTPPHRLVLSRSSPEAVHHLVRHLRARSREPAGVIGVPDTAQAFARVWTENGGSFRVVFRQRIYEVTEVVPPRSVSGHLRAARESDVELLTPWCQRFQIETGLGSITPEQARRAIEERIATTTLFVWEDGGAPVSLAALTRPTSTRIGINYVYTPDALRGRGFAKACVAALSQRALEDGRAACCLFADLANPISNRVYLAIGFRPVADDEVIDFVPTEVRGLHGD